MFSTDCPITGSAETDTSARPMIAETNGFFNAMQLQTLQAFVGYREQHPGTLPQPGQFVHL